MFFSSTTRLSSTASCLLRSVTSICFALIIWTRGSISHYNLVVMSAMGFLDYEAAVYFSCPVPSRYAWKHSLRISMLELSILWLSCLVRKWKYPDDDYFSLWNLLFSSRKCPRLFFIVESAMCYSEKTLSVLLNESDAIYEVRYRLRSLHISGPYVCNAFLCKEELPSETQSNKAMPFCDWRIIKAYTIIA